MLDSVVYYQMLRFVELALAHYFQYAQDHFFFYRVDGHRET
jgi:hypothetical protein